MGAFTALENSNIVIDLLQQANTTGWSIPGDGTSVHDSCNSGSIILNNYPVKAGNNYKVSYAILSISGGYVQLNAGGTFGTHHTTAAPIVETITATADGFIYFFSNANCVIMAFNVQNTFADISNTQENTLVYDVKNKKFGFRTIAPDFGQSIYVDMLTWYQGNTYLHENGSDDRNNFYGTQYQTIFQHVENKAAAELKSYNSIVLQSNQLLVTTDGGITTSLGQVSSLIDQDFLKSVLNDGVTTINVYSQVGVYSASFLRDQNFPSDIVNGDSLVGNYIIVELTTINGNTPLRLFSVAVNASRKAIGSR
jgi:hypothetical protein